MALFRGFRPIPLVEDWGSVRARFTDFSGVATCLACGGRSRVQASQQRNDGGFTSVHTGQTQLSESGILSSVMPIKGWLDGFSRRDESVLGLVSLGMGGGDKDERDPGGLFPLGGTYECPCCSFSSS